MQNNFLLFICVFCFWIPSVTHAILPDLEQNTQNFVLETKKIEIPGYSHAFNPSLIGWEGKLLMSFRYIPDANKPYNSELGLVFLNEEFQPISTPEIIIGNDPNSDIPSRADDGRLVAVGDHLYLVYSNNQDALISKGGYRLFVAELTYTGSRFLVIHKEALTDFEGANNNVREKNWVPFDYLGSLFLAYSIEPHKIFYPLLQGTGKCETLFKTTASIQWKWGELRGGTPALRMGDQYLAFFHSSIPMESQHSFGKVCPHYFMGAYTFSIEPPFALTSLSPEPIIGTNFYHGATYKRYWGSVVVVYPGSFIFDENYIWIAYGRQDHECWIVKIEKAGLLKSLIPINSSRQ